MRIDILTLFPSMFSPLGESIIGKAKAKGLLDINITDIRSFARDKHKTADDTPYGGGPGMVMKPELIFEAVESIKAKLPTPNIKHPNKSQITNTKSQTNPKSQIPNPKQLTILLTPAGKPLTNAIVKDLAIYEHLILICGHYEGVDQRVIDELVDEEISIGDYVLTGGELPAMVLIDAMARFIPGVLGDETSATEETFSQGLLEYPQYTKPGEHMGKKVPEVLLGGDHKKIAKWRRKESIKKTFFARPDLLAGTKLSGDDMATLADIFTGGG